MAIARRDSVHTTLMQVAKVLSTRSTCSSKHAVGAVLARSGRIIATGYNGNLPHQDHCNDVGCVPDADGRCTRAVHAEQNAILQCAKYGVATEGAVMYSTLAPCLTCAKAIVMAGISTVIIDRISSASAIDTLIHAGVMVYQLDDTNDTLIHITRCTDV